MVRNMSPKPREGNGGAPPAAAESIDQVRDLLFGSQMRMVDVRLQSLDERLSHETSAMRAEFERQLGELDGSIRKELARQAERLAAERAKRIEDLKALAGELKEALRSLEKRHHGLEEAAGQADAELRDQLLKHSTAFAAELGRTSERLSAELERITSALQAEKLDASSLIAGLTELAGKLGGVTPTAGKRSARS